MTQRGIGGRSGMVKMIDGLINSTLVDPLGRPLAAILLFVAGLGAAWLVRRATQ